MSNGGISMKHIGLTTYGINIRNEEHQQYEMHNILGTAFLDIIENVAQNNLNIYDDDSRAEQIFTFDKVERKIVKNENDQDIYEALFLRIKTGEYGTESEIINKETGALTYKKEVGDADVLPFGCCIMVPCGEFTSGIITLQSLGRYGIKTVMLRKIDSYLKDINSNLRFVMGAIVPKVYMERFLNDGVLQAVRFIRYAIPNDDADRYGVNRGAEGISEERVLRKPTGFLRHKLDDINACMNGSKRYDQIVQIDGFEIDDLKLDFKMGNRTKTISMKNLDNLIASEDVTNDVELENGNPTFESLNTVMEETGRFYLKAKGLLL